MNLLSADIPRPDSQLKAGCILLCAPSRWEAAAFIRTLKLKPASKDLYVGTHQGRSIELLKTGMGPKNAEQSLKNFKAPESLGCVVLAGLAGALQSGMRPGDLALDLRGADISLVESAREIAAALNLPVHFGRILSSDRIIATATEKAALGLKERACAVEMEAGPVSAWSARHQVPFYHVRTVLDTVTEALPGDLPQGEDLLSLASYAAAHPSAVPALMLLGLRQKRAMRGLSLFMSRFLETL